MCTDSILERRDYARSCFQFLNPLQIFRISSVCKTWHELSQEPQSFSAEWPLSYRGGGFQSGSIVHPRPLRRIAFKNISEPRQEIILSFCKNLTYEVDFRMLPNPSATSGSVEFDNETIIVHVPPLPPVDGIESFYVKSKIHVSHITPLTTILNGCQSIRVMNHQLGDDVISIPSSNSIQSIALDCGSVSLDNFPNIQFLKITLPTNENLQIPHSVKYLHISARMIFSFAQLPNPSIPSNSQIEGLFLDVEISPSHLDSVREIVDGWIQNLPNLRKVWVPSSKDPYAISFSGAPHCVPSEVPGVEIIFIQEKEHPKWFAPLSGFAI